MSEINKPENADLKCPFDLNQYNIGDNNITVPAGTSAWALSLVYLGKQVHRSGWNAPIEHMRLAHKSEVGNTDDGDAYIEKSDKNGYWSRWTPTQEDLLACDWRLLESLCSSEDSMLVFDLTSGADKNSNDQYWGYSSGKYDSSLGDLSIVQNKTDIAEFSLLYWIEYNSSALENQVFWNISSYPNEESVQKVAKLFSKVLVITVDNISYNLGRAKDASSLEGESGGKYGYVASYFGSEAAKLGAIMKHKSQIRFCCKWG
ncbi:DUF2829 domain-containing protein [Xenorhabdus sp. XENO-1]|uniref:Thoeris anti-defense Tad2 family protein n=1 Tax=Xenorhabdus bovienii TaxID=40576 RepID=UPI0020CA43E2|nr:MW1434 family type I TA system toxin [Xenorhabdus bovienii]MCP9266841.1 DUF2829 domain-containing protein [Xenorhabdus bovienii subsp. africana]